MGRGPPSSTPFPLPPLFLLPQVWGRCWAGVGVGGNLLVAPGLNLTLLCLCPAQSGPNGPGVRLWGQPGVFLPEQRGTESEETVWAHPGFCR